MNDMINGQNALKIKPKSC